MSDMTAQQTDEMYDNIQCPRCGQVSYCDDLRRTGRQEMKALPHKERITAYKAWKKEQV